LIDNAGIVNILKGIALNNLDSFLIKDAVTGLFT
jgi:hypothetical protein